MHAISGQAKELKEQIERVLRKEHEERFPNPLMKRARKSYIGVTLTNPERNATVGETTVRADEPALIQGRLWIWRYNEIWVMEYEHEKQRWRAVPASLPVGHLWDETRRVPAGGGAEIRTVLPARYKTTNDEGREVWRRTELRSRPCEWAGPNRRAVYTDGTNYFWLGKTVNDRDNRTVYEVELCPDSAHPRRGCPRYDQRRLVEDREVPAAETINLLLQTQRRVDSVTIDEKYIEVEADDLEEREVRGEEITIYTDSEGHEYEVDRSSEIVKDGAKTYLAVRGV